MNEVKTLFDAGVRIDEAHAVLTDCIDLLNLIVRAWKMKARETRKASSPEFRCILAPFLCCSEVCYNWQASLSLIVAQ